MEKKRGWWMLVGMVCVSILLLPGGYVGAYYALVTPLPPGWRIWNPVYGGGTEPFYGPVSWTGFDAAVWRLFLPIHWVDRKLRPKLWDGPR